MTTPRERREEVARVRQGFRPKAAVMERAKQDTEAALVEVLVDLRDVQVLGCQLWVDILAMYEDYLRPREEPQP